MLDLGNIGVGSKYTYNLKMWIDSNATNEVTGTVFKGQLRIEATQGLNKVGKVADLVFNEESLGSKGAIDTSDSEQTFITGEDPNNYVWYSGRLWRAVSMDTVDRSVKLMTQWNATTINPFHWSEEKELPYFQESYMKDWLNDTSVDGFLGNLRDAEKFIKMDSLWNATLLYPITPDVPKLEKTTMVKSPVGALNAYEYRKSYGDLDPVNGYLNTKFRWVTITPATSDNINITASSVLSSTGSLMSGGLPGIRPAVNLNPEIEIISGNGTESNPYRLKGDYDTPRSGSLLNTRYSGEYVRFGSGENNLYRIVSKELGGAKLVSATPLQDNAGVIKKYFNNDTGMGLYDPNDPVYEVAYFLNHDFLDPANGYFTSSQVEMIENSPWYLGSLDQYSSSYRLAKYREETGDDLVSNSVKAKVGLLRLGEQMSGQDMSIVEAGGSRYCLLTTDTSGYSYAVTGTPSLNAKKQLNAIRPAVHLKKSVKITGGDGTKENPFTIAA